MPSRQLPASLTDALRAERHLEDLAADTAARRRHAIAATSTLLLAARNAGWTEPELAAIVGMKRSAVNARIRTELGRRDDTKLGLEEVEPPPNPELTERQRRLAGPLADRDWLTGPEAAAAYGCSNGVLTQWRRARHAPRHGHHDADSAAVQPG